MTTEDALNPESDAAAEIAALEHELELLCEIRDSLASQPGSDVTVGAVSGLIEERRAELERSRRPPA